MWEPCSDRQGDSPEEVKIKLFVSTDTVSLTLLSVNTVVLSYSQRRVDFKTENEWRRCVVKEVTEL